MFPVNDGPFPSGGTLLLNCKSRVLYKLGGKIEGGIFVPWLDPKSRALVCQLSNSIFLFILNYFYMFSKGI